jgi:uncharacterized coiled-coil protein SlyX
MKTYRHPETGDKQRVHEDDDAAIASLESQGYVEWGATEIKQRIADRKKAMEEAKEAMKAAREEVKNRYPGAYAVPDEEATLPPPLNPNAQVQTEAELASATPQKSGATSVPAVPKKLNG